MTRDLSKHNIPLKIGFFFNFFASLFHANKLVVNSIFFIITKKNVVSAK